MNDDDRREQIYAGSIFVSNPSTASIELIELAKEMLFEAFKPHDPLTVQNHLTPANVAGILSKLKPAFIHHPECKKIIPRILEENGVDLEKCYYDVPRMRSAYPSDFLTSGIAYAFHPHRDTWYSAPMCQINWWLPIFPIEAGNAMGFYMDYFDKAIQNNSETYNYYEWNKKSRAQASKHVKGDTREQPKPQEDVVGDSIKYLPPPGGIIAFSGAHLHESVPNHTGVTRYSIDFRTVHVDDLELGRGAPNHDSRCTGTTLRDYISARDGTLLPDRIVEMLDDATAKESEILRFGDRLLDDAQGAAVRE